MEVEEQLEAIKLIDQQAAGLNKVKDTVSLLKLMNKQQQEIYENNPDVKTLVLCNTEMLSVVVDALEKLSKNEWLYNGCVLPHDNSNNSEHFADRRYRWTIIKGIFYQKQYQK